MKNKTTIDKFKKELVKLYNSNLKEFWSIVILFKAWLNKNNTLPIIKRDVGYYDAKIGELWYTRMESGRNAFYRCIDVVYFTDPPDMIKNNT